MTTACVDGENCQSWWNYIQHNYGPPKSCALWNSLDFTHNLWSFRPKKNIWERQIRICTPNKQRIIRLMYDFHSTINSTSSVGICVLKFRNSHDWNLEWLWHSPCISVYNTTQLRQQNNVSIQLYKLPLSKLDKFSWWSFPTVSNFHGLSSDVKRLP